MIRNIFTFIVLGTLLACESTTEKAAEAVTLEFPIQNLSDEEYPDNPDIGFRSKNYNPAFFSKGEISGLDLKKQRADLFFYTSSNDTIGIQNLDLSEFIPTIPESLKGDHYLSYIACVNQEWNRNQVRFNPKEFQSTNSRIIRVDVARNCLNAYLWEVIVYTEENGQTVPFSHGWFDFPHESYAQLFEQKNGQPFDNYRAPLEHWVDPKSEVVDLSKLRTVNNDVQVTFADSSDAMYPLAGARKKKLKEVIYPESFETMRDLQTDSALFATFTIPGFYNRKDPRTTELGRLYTLKSAAVKQVESTLNGERLSEVSLNFEHRNGKDLTTIVFGGLDFDAFPVLGASEANDGWKTSMGIGNHTFYEDYPTHNALEAASNPYYGLILDAEGRWLDSHKVGIDGPIMHFADAERTELHIWLLTFERHALVGHYVVSMQQQAAM